ncbi:hypothetical protein NE237_017809 [Protea cynaroides]|uniref:Uncharacterized protein n=1 Tax=Protea cynaroides TaxID=273540 RepID=A0A9Q0K8S7_9MAGN|nr:hypothetical protein NE237_017809 [Protea cynaroides]
MLLPSKYPMVGFVLLIVHLVFNLGILMNLFDILVWILVVAVLMAISPDVDRTALSVMKWATPVIQASFFIDTMRVILGGLFQPRALMRMLFRLNRMLLSLLPLLQQWRYHINCRL